MKKLFITLSICIVLTSSHVSHAMQRCNDQLTEETLLTLHKELITKIAALCKPTTRISLSLTNKHLNTVASIDKNKDILWEEHFIIPSKSRFYYLFLGCIDNNSKLVMNALKKFDTEQYHIGFNFNLIFPDKLLLNKAKYFIEQLTQSNATQLVPYDPNIYLHFNDTHDSSDESDDVTENDDNDTIFDFAIDVKDVKLFELCCNNPLCIIPNKLPDKLYDALLEHFHILDKTVKHINNKDNNEYIAIFKILLAHKPNIIYDFLWSTNNLNTAKIFFAYETNDSINKQIGNNKNTLLHTHIFESWDSYEHIIKLLLTHPNINVNAQDETGDAPLHNAVINGHVRVMTFLLAHPKININIKNQRGNTPLHEAIKYKNIKAVILLLNDPQIDITIQNNKGLSPFSYGRTIQQKIIQKTWNLAMQPFMTQSGLLYMERNIETQTKINDILLQLYNYAARKK